MSYFEIKTKHLTLKITLEEVSKLHIHEEIIPEMYEKLVEKIKQDGFFKDPVIVDEKTLVVLDGMHRVAAAQTLRFPYMPVCLIDYDNPEVKLKSWCRAVVKASGKIDEVLSAIREVGLEVDGLNDISVAFDLLKSRKIIVAVVDGKSLFVVKSPVNDIKSIYDWIKRVENALKDKGYEVKYITEEEAFELAKSGQVVASLITPVITKEEVRSVALRGEVFIHKATRHIVPARPMNVRVPLEWLDGSIPLDRARKLLTDYLERRRIRTLPPGTVLDRRYDEELFVFE
ncbi:MAG: ParB N-terminal domain-containing protein [Thermosphaera sp.]